MKYTKKIDKKALSRQSSACPQPGANRPKKNIFLFAAILGIILLTGLYLFFSPPVIANNVKSAQNKEIVKLRPGKLRTVPSAPGVIGGSEKIDTPQIPLFNESDTYKPVKFSGPGTETPPAISTTANIHTGTPRLTSVTVLTGKKPAVKEKTSGAENYTPDTSPAIGDSYGEPHVPIYAEIRYQPDFNGDGKADLLWRNTITGRNRVWLMDGLNLLEDVELDPWPDPAWGIAGTGDFDGNGHTDILWRNCGSGENRIWLMDRLFLKEDVGLASWSDPAWGIASIGDFDRDGQTDILWRNTENGKIAVWLMSGTIPLSSQSLPLEPDPSWEIVVQ